MQCRLVPATGLCQGLLAACCLLVFLRAGHSLNLTVGELPIPSQKTHRILATLTSSPVQARQWFIDKQLQSYAEMCEIGFEVHVVIVGYNTQKPEELAALDGTIFHPKSRHHCQRINMAIPVAIALYPMYVPGINSTSGTGGVLAAMHREVFSQKADLYDYFISQEDDMHIRPNNILYYTRWLHHFQQVKGLPEPVVPAFLHYEVIMQNITETWVGKVTSHHSVADMLRANMLRWHHPTTLTFLQHGPTFEILDIGGVPCIALFSSYAASYIISQDHLKLAMSKKAWKRDVSLDFKEYNPHFQGQWLSHYWKLAIPIQALRHAMVHHCPDKYTPQHTVASNNHDNQTAHVPELTEVQYLIQNCTGKPAEHSSVRFPYPSLTHNQTNIIYSGDANLASQPAPCSVCAKDGKSAKVTFKFTGPSLAAQPMKPTSLFYVDVRCTNWIATQMTQICRDETTACWDQFSPA